MLASVHAWFLSVYANHDVVTWQNTEAKPCLLANHRPSARKREAAEKFPDLVRNTTQGSKLFGGLSFARHDALIADLQGASIRSIWTS